MELALARLPGVQREVLAMRESDGLTFSEIARLLELPVATVKSRVRYALTKLANELRAFAPEQAS
jgi:RNA polymerase sigma-70 factor (ECF subfamily)